LMKWCETGWQALSGNERGEPKVELRTILIYYNSLSHRYTTLRPRTYSVRGDLVWCASGSCSIICSSMNLCYFVMINRERGWKFTWKME
jgi:hypothetical protein